MEEVVKIPAGQISTEGINTTELKDLALISFIVGCQFLIALAFINIFPA